MNWTGAANSRMEMNKKYYIISGSILIVLALLAYIHKSNGDYYRISVEEAFASLQDGSAGEMNASDSTVLTIELIAGDSAIMIFDERGHHISLTSDQLLEKKFLQRLRKQEGSIVILSEDAGLAIHSWLILRRMGIRNLKIAEHLKNEKPEYTFEPEEE